MLNNDTWFDPAYARTSFLPITNNALDLGSTSLYFRKSYTNEVHGASTLKLGVAGTEWLNINTSGHLTFLATNSRIQTNTSDGTDNKILYILGGGGTGNGRGAQVILSGNEASGSNGILYLYSGDASSAYVDINATSATSPTIRLSLASTERWRLSANDFIGMTASVNSNIYRNDKSGAIRIGGGDGFTVASGAFIELYGHSHASTPGRMYFYSGSASGLMIFQMGVSSGSFAFKNASAVNLLSLSDTQFYTNVPTGGDYSFRINASQVMALDASGLKLPSLADGSAGNDRWYYSTTQNKACYKDSGGTVNALY